MQSLKHIFLRRMSKKTVTDSFDLNSENHLETLTSIQQASDTHHISIYFEILKEEPQRLDLFSSPDQPPPLNPRESYIDRTRTAENIFAIASYTKVLINVAYTRLFEHERYKGLGISWDSPACDVYNGFRAEKGKSQIARLWGNPEIRHLLCHFNGIAPMNRYLFAPDGTFIMSEEEFIQAAPLITKDRYQERYPHRGWVEYSNGNHIFAGMILQEVTDKGIQDLMQELVFDWLDMAHTVMNEASLFARAATATIVEGRQNFSGQGEAIAKPVSYMSDIVEVASLGARSSTTDIAKLNRAFLQSAENKGAGKFSDTAMLNFFSPRFRLPTGGAATLAGLYGTLNSPMPGEESLNHKIRQLTNAPAYSLGRRPDGSKCEVYYKGGTIDGFSSSTYLLINDRAFVIVLGNSSGPLDATDHIARYIMQEAFHLSPRIDIKKFAAGDGQSARKYLRKLEHEDEETLRLAGRFEDLAGTYQHVRYTQRMTITQAGEITIHGKEKSSGSMEVAYTSSNTIRIFPGKSNFGSERLTSWEDLEFFVNLESGGILSLIGNRGRDCYKKI